MSTENNENALKHARIVELIKNADIMQLMKAGLQINIDTGNIEVIAAYVGREQETQQKIRANFEKEEFKFKKFTWMTT